MKAYVYRIVDAFSLKPYRGNPAAVVFDADDIAPGQMQTIARHLNLSETVFLCRPEADGADYRARIFTPREEIPFAGHPTIAAAFAYYHRLEEDERRRVTRLVQECGIGTVPIEVEARGGAPFFTLKAGSASAKEAGVTRVLAARMLGCEEDGLSDLPMEVCSGGLPWLIVKLRSIDVSKNLVPDQSLIDEVCRARGATGVTTYCDGAGIEGVDHHVRTFAPSVGITEDPACGSGNIALAVHIARHTHVGRPAFSFTSEQGLEVEREALLHVDVTRGPSGEPVVRLGGHAVQTAEGRLLG